MIHTFYNKGDQNITLLFQIARIVAFRGQTHFAPEIFKMSYRRHYKIKCVDFPPTYG